MIYLAIFAAQLSTIVLPLPEEVVLIGAGILARSGRAEVVGCFLVSWAAVILGDVATFLVGRFLLARLVRTRFGERLVNPKRRKWAEDLVERHGWRSITMGRFLVGLRMFVFLAIGAACYPVWRFVLIDGAVGLFEVALLIGIGYLYGQLHRHTGTWIDLVAAGVLAIALFSPVVVRWVRDRRGRKRQPA